MAQCVYCSKTQDLNTSLTITLEDGNKVSVDICDEHAEEATIKSAREAYQDKQAKIEEVLAQAKALGLNLSETGGGLTVATAPPAPEPAPAPAPEGMTVQAVESKQPAPAPLEGDDVVDTAKLTTHGMQSVGGNVQGTNVTSHASHGINDLQSKLPAEVLQGKAKMAIVEGREGQPIAIPQKRVDGTGTTRIRIKKTEGDAQLQERFKRMAADSQSSYDNSAGPDFRYSGYNEAQRDCPFCRGEGEVNNQECPKCKGAGFISIY